MIAAFVALVVGTFVSEDLACVAAGLMIHRGELHPIVGLAGCATGIFVGDLGLFVAGRLLGARALSWSVVRRYLTPAHEARFAAWFSRHAAGAMLGSRLTPGTRLPLYVATGALGGSATLFATWSLVAVTIWVPAVVLTTARYGGASADALALRLGGSWAARAAVALFILTAWRTGLLLTTTHGRQRLAARVSRTWRWEFWPMWLFYAPVGAWTAWLAVRHRGFHTITAANPAIADGGVVGESKYEILRHLPPEWTIPSALVAPAGSPAERLDALRDLMEERHWTFPLVLKPDFGQRGAGVRHVRARDEAAAYFSREALPVLVQPYHPGPFEAGIFYYRFPDEPRGCILSITDKRFPALRGDGRSTVEQLIWRDRRLRMQAGTFLARHADVRDCVLAGGEPLPLVMAGNHAQGTLFKDGAHLITPALERRIDAIATAYRGFYIGRFDVRYADIERFKAGEDLAIVELNGATAESTNIYDPERSLLAAYRQLFLQWSLVFAIGAANRARGEPVSSPRRLFDLVRAHLGSRVGYEISD